jgi:hypothetical protein
VGRSADVRLAAPLSGKLGGRRGCGVGGRGQERGHGLALRGGHPGGKGPDPGVVGGQAFRRAGCGERGQLDQHVAPVARVRASVHPPGPLQPVDQHGDGAGGQGQPLAEVPLGKRAVRLQVLERVQVGGADAGVAGQRGPHPVALQAEPLQGAGQVFCRLSRHLTPV